MPQIYEIELPNGKLIEIESDTPPTADSINRAVRFASASEAKQFDLPSSPKIPSGREDLADLYSGFKSQFASASIGDELEDPISGEKIIKTGDSKYAAPSWKPPLTDSERLANTLTMAGVQSPEAAAGLIAAGAVTSRVPGIPGLIGGAIAGGAAALGAGLARREVQPEAITKAEQQIMEQDPTSATVGRLLGSGMKPGQFPTSVKQAVAERVLPAALGAGVAGGMEAYQGNLGTKEGLENVGQAALENLILSDTTKLGSKVFGAAARAPKAPDVTTKLGNVKAGEPLTTAGATAAETAMTPVEANLPPELIAKDTVLAQPEPPRPPRGTKVPEAKQTALAEMLVAEENADWRTKADVQAQKLDFEIGLKQFELEKAKVDHEIQIQKLATEAEKLRLREQKRAAELEESRRNLSDYEAAKSAKAEEARVKAKKQADQSAADQLASEISPIEDTSQIDSKLAEIEQYEASIADSGASIPESIKTLKRDLVAEKFAIETRNELAQRRADADRLRVEKAKADAEAYRRKNEARIQAGQGLGEGPLGEFQLKEPMALEGDVLKSPEAQMAEQQAFNQKVADVIVNLRNEGVKVDRATAANLARKAKNPAEFNAARQKLINDARANEVKIPKKGPLKSLADLQPAELNLAKPAEPVVEAPKPEVKPVETATVEAEPTQVIDPVNTVPEIIKNQLDRIKFTARRLAGAASGLLTKKVLIDPSGRVLEVDDSLGHPAYIKENLPEYLTNEKPDVRRMVNDGWYWGSVAKTTDGNYQFIDGATPSWAAKPAEQVAAQPKAARASLIRERMAARRGLPKPAAQEPAAAQPEVAPQAESAPSRMDEFGMEVLGKKVRVYRKSAELGSPWFANVDGVEIPTSATARGKARDAASRAVVDYVQGETQKPAIAKETPLPAMKEAPLIEAKPVEEPAPIEKAIKPAEPAKTTKVEQSDPLKEKLDYLDEQLAAREISKEEHAQLVKEAKKARQSPKSEAGFVNPDDIPNIKSGGKIDSRIQQAKNTTVEEFTSKSINKSNPFPEAKNEPIADFVSKLNISDPKSQKYKSLIDKLIADGHLDGINIETTEVIANKQTGARAGGAFENASGKIYLPKTAASEAQAMRHFAHEVIHAALFRKIRDVTGGSAFSRAIDESDLVIGKKIQDMLRKARGAAYDSGQDFYGITNAQEFVAEAVTNPKFQKFLDGIKIDGESMWSRFAGFVKSLFGLSESKSVLSETLSATGELLNSPVRSEGVLMSESFNRRNFSDVYETSFAGEHKMLKEMPASSGKKGKSDFLEVNDDDSTQPKSLYRKLISGALSPEGSPAAEIENRMFDAITSPEKQKDYVWSPGALTRSSDFFENLGVVTSNIRRISPAVAGKVRDWMKWEVDTVADAATKSLPGLTKLRELVGKKRFEQEISPKLLSGKEDEVFAEISKMEGGGEVVAEIEAGWIKTREEIRAALAEAFPEKEIGDLQHYFPRELVDVRKLRRYLDKEDPSVVGRALKDAAERKGEGLTREEESDIIANILMGMGKTGGGPGYLKARTIKDLDSKLAEFYQPADVAVDNYLRKVIRKIGERKFAGKFDSEKVDPLNVESMGGSVGNALLDEIKAGKVSSEGANTILRNLNGILTRPQSDAWQYAVNKWGGFLTVNANLAQAFTAITQLSDVFAAAGYLSPKDALFAFPKALFKAKDRVKIEDLKLQEGNADVQEFARGFSGKQAAITNIMLPLLKWSDTVGKETFLTALKSHAKRESAKAPEQQGVTFRASARQYEEMFGKAEIDALYKALKENAFDSPAFLKFAFNRLSDVQPITRAEFALGKNKASPAAKIMWGLTSFQIKQTNNALENTYGAWKKGNKADAAKWAASYAFWAGMGYSVIQFLRDIKDGKDEITLGDGGDYLFGAALQMAGLNKYMLADFQGGNYAKALGERVAPGVFTAPKAIGKDAASIRDAIRGEKEFGETLRDLETLKLAPLVGDIYYKNIGGGKTKAEEKARSRKEEKGALESFIEGIIGADSSRSRG